jgi:hypothetical protein
MSVAINSKYRSLEYISNKIKTFSSFEAYLNSITIKTAKNYKLPIEEYIDKLENHKVKEEYKNLFNKKITNVFGDDFKAIDEQLIFILDELENIYLNQNKIISHDDLVFILSLVSIGVKKKLKDILFFSSIENTENKEVFILSIIKNSKREMFLIKKRCNLISKAFTTLENINKSDISLKISLNETIHKYFFQKNNYENINILTLKSILALYFSKTLKGV